MKTILPLAILLVGAGVAVLLFLSRPEPEAREPEVVPTPVDYVVAESEPTVLRVRTQGTVSPEQRATVAAEVGGLVVAVSPNLDPGKFVAEDEVLAEVDPTDFEAALAEARASLRSAETALLQAEADAEQAVRDLEEVGVENPSPLARREPQLRQARLRVESAQAALDLARKNLARTKIRAPFAGQVVETFVDRGDVLPNRGSPVARVNATAYAEARLPLSRDELRHLDLPAVPARVDAPPAGKPRARLSLGAGPDLVERQGWIDRLEGTVDPVTRLRYAVARVRDPLDLDGGGSHAIPFGAFVEARIEGRKLDSAFRLPVVALVGENRVRIIDAEDRLREREIEVVKRNGNDVVVTAGIADGDRICLTPLETFVDGMPARPLAPAAGTTGAKAGAKAGAGSGRPERDPESGNDSAPGRDPGTES